MNSSINNFHPSRPMDDKALNPKPCMSSAASPSSLRHGSSQQFSIQFRDIQLPSSDPRGNFLTKIHNRSGLSPWEEMAQSVSAIDEAIAHLDSILARLMNSEPAAAPAAPVPAFTTPAVISGDPIESAEEVVDVKPKKREEKPIPDILKGRNLKLPGAKAATNAPVASGNEQNDNFDKALLQVAVVQSVENHPNSEKLYVCKIDVGGGTIKQVVAGLKKFVTVEELQGKLVCVILNLKTAKLAGQVSEAMILAGSVATAEGSENVKVLEPPSESAPGDRIFQEGGSPSASPAKQLSSKVWEKIVPLLKVEGGLAVFDSKPLVTSSGSIKVPGLPDGAAIH